MAVRWASKEEGIDDIWAGVSVCGACRRPVAFRLVVAGAAFDPSQVGGAIQPSQWRQCDFFPGPPQDEAPADVPAEVERVYLQAQDALRRRHLDAAATMYRKALQVALVKLHADMAGKTLAAAIRELARRGELLAALADTADAVRIDGNAAAHEVEEIDEHRARAIAELTRMLLQYLFTLPQAVQRLRASVAANA